jgi:hypothetical protein
MMILIFSIGAAGFEPTTPTTPKWCATKLRYAPNKPNKHIITLALSTILLARQPLALNLKQHLDANSPHSVVLYLK